MNTTQLTRVRRCFNSDLVSPQINRANRLKWVRCIRRLGPNWVLNNFEQKKEQTQ